MRRNCWMLFCLPAACGIASAADNPFVRPPQPMIARKVEIVATANRPQPPGEEVSLSEMVLSQDRPALFPPVIETPPPNLNLSAEDGVNPAYKPEDEFPELEPGRNPLFGPSIYGDDRIARVTDDRIVIPRLIAPTTNISTIGSKNKPEDIGGEALSDIEILPEGFDREGDWALTSYFWQAPNTFSLPLFFEDVMLERHGHERHPALTPMLAGARFFGTLPMLPYLATVRDPHECYYHLGYYRPGSCAPPLLQRPPYVRKAAIVQGAATAGAFIALP